jgi:hypothetical protein
MLCSVGEQGGPGEGAQPPGNISFFMTPILTASKQGPQRPLLSTRLPYFS